jgi:hypothetical protein
MNKPKILDNAGSLSENDMGLLAGTELIQTMMRNRILVMSVPNQEMDWVALTAGVTGLYHIRSINQRSLYQVWFESPTDIDKFKKNLFIAIVGNNAHA